MLLEMQDGDSGDTKDSTDNPYDNNTLHGKIDYTMLPKNNHLNNKTNDNNNYEMIKPTLTISNKQRVTTKVLSKKALLEHILSYIPIECLNTCCFVNNNWYLIIKYIVPIPLISLKTLAMGELLYWLPGENQFPKTVALKLRFSSGIPKFIQITTSVKKQETKHKNGYHKNGMTHKQETKMVSTSGHYQMLELSEILFIIDGHWTPIFEQLNEENASFDHDESQFFHRSKCFSIVTNTYMTYDFISFNAQTNKHIVNTLGTIIHQTHDKSSKMAIHAKATKKYYDALNQTPLIFKDTLSALNFEMFVLILQDCINKIGSELDIDIHSEIKTQVNASLLYPMILEDNVLFSEWYPWCRSHIFETLKLNGYIKQIDDNINANNQYGIINDEIKDNNNDNNNHDDSDKKEEILQVIYDGKKKNRRGSSLFDIKSFPMNEEVDLFAVNSDDDEVNVTYDNELLNDLDPRYNDIDDSNCIVM